MRKYLIILLVIFPVLVYGQAKEIAIKNFESFYAAFKNAYPADKSQYSFKDYSDLDTIRDFPEELKMMVDYEPGKFYSLYLYHIRYLRDTLINIADLELNADIKETYKMFRQSVLDGEIKGEFNHKKDKSFSNRMKNLLKNSLPPRIGYSQITTITVISPYGETKESKLLITYNNEFSVVTFGIIQD